MDRVSITLVPEYDRAVLDDMAQTYFAELLPDGPEIYPSVLDQYWAEEGGFAYLIDWAGVPIGFALVRVKPDASHELTEFTILQNMRQKGLGAEAAQKIFRKHPGLWTLGVASKSPGARKFWQHCLNQPCWIADVTEGPPGSAHQICSFSFVANHHPTNDRKGQE